MVSRVIVRRMKCKYTMWFVSVSIVWGTFWGLFGTTIGSSPILLTSPPPPLILSNSLICDLVILFNHLVIEVIQPSLPNHIHCICSGAQHNKFLSFVYHQFPGLTTMWRSQPMSDWSSYHWWSWDHCILMLLTLDIQYWRGGGGRNLIYWMSYDHLSHSWLNWSMRMIEEDEVVLKEKPEDTRYIKKITSKY